MTEEERQELIEEAISMVEEAKELVDQAVKGTSKESHYKAYGCYGFSQLLGTGNPYDPSLFELLPEEW